MKFKSLGFLIVMAFSAASAQAAVELISSDAITSGASGKCTLLAEDVRLNMSANVRGVYNCNKSDNSIRVATCHAAGSRKDTTIKCAKIGEAQNGDAIWNVNGCSATVTEVDVKDSFRAFGSSTTGGSVAATPLDGDCDTQGNSLKKLEIVNPT